MASPKNRRSKRGARVSIDQYNTERRERNIKHEIRLTEKKIDKLLKRNRSGKIRTPAKHLVRDGKDVVKVVSIPRKQGILPNGQRHQALLTHLKYLKGLLEK